MNIDNTNKICYKQLIFYLYPTRLLKKTIIKSPKTDILLIRENKVCYT